MAYSEQSFRAEMDRFGFDVLELAPVVRNFALQSEVSYRLERWLPWAADALVKSLESFPGRQALEWVAVCQKRA